MKLYTKKKIFFLKKVDSDSFFHTQIKWALEIIIRVEFRLH